MPNPVPHDRRTLTLRERLQITWFTWKYSGTKRMEVLDDWMDDHDPSAHEGLKAYVEQREARLHRGGEAR